MSINTDPCALIATPMADLLTQFSLSNKLVSLQFVIPPQNEFNNSALSLFAGISKNFSNFKYFHWKSKKTIFKEILLQREKTC